MASSSMVVTLADAAILLSLWKPVLVFLPFIPWAWLITTVYDKHAERFHLARREWNLLHLSLGLIAFLVAVAMPIQAPWAIGISVLAVLAILAIDVAAYPLMANRDERVPEAHRLTLNFAAYLEAQRQKKDAKQAGSSELRVLTPDKQEVRVPDKDSPEFTRRLEAEHVLTEALAARASRVEVRPVKEGTYGVLMMIDNVRAPGKTIPAAEAVQIIDFWKQAAGMNVEDRRRKQSGLCSAVFHEEKINLAIKSSGMQGGMSLSMVINPGKAVRRTPDELGLLEPQLAAVNELVERPGGIVIVSVPAGQGGTTTVYTLTKMHDAYTQNVQTIEHEIEDKLEGVRQNKFDPTQESASFSTLVRSTLRRDPDIVSVLDVPDEQTAKECVSGDLERTRVYATLKAGDAIKGVRSFIRAVGDPAQATEHLQGAISSRTIRRLCPNCRLAYQPTPDMLRKLGLPADKVKQLFKKSGQVQAKNKNEPETCPQCQGSGYFGVDAIFEVFLFDAEHRELAKNDDASGLKAAFRKKGYPTMQQAALRKAVDGITSIEEILRVTGEGDKPKSSGQSGGKPGGQSRPAQPTPQ